MKVNLETCYHWRGRPWGPGPTEIPDGLAAALGLSGTPDTPSKALAIAPADDAPAPADPTLAAAVERLEDLRLIYQVDGWKAIKAIADPLKVKKHPDGWDSSLLLIIEQEFSPAIAAELED